MADFRIEGHGTVMLVAPLTTTCEEWLADNVEADGWQWMGGKLAVEPRYLPTVIEEMLDAGLVEEGIGE